MLTQFQRIVAAATLLLVLAGQLSRSPAFADGGPVAPQNIGPLGDHALLMQLAAQVSSDRAVIASLRSQLADQQARLDQLSARPPRPDATTTSYGPFTVAGADVYLTGYNLHIQSGSGSTSGAVNGLGNLIIGYNETRGSGHDHRNGSHNLIVGDEANFTSYGGIVAGHENSISAAYASVTGGRSNQATATYASVSGGYQNFATGAYASVSGGSVNTASAEFAAASGGYSNSVSGEYACVSGGRSNYAAGNYCWAAGGYGNEAEENATTAVGGFFNIANDDYASVFAGYGNTAGGEYASVTGGSGNTAEGYYSSVSGGEDVTESTDYYWRGGAYESH